MFNTFNGYGLENNTLILHNNRLCGSSKIYIPRHTILAIIDGKEFAYQYCVASFLLCLFVALNSAMLPSEMIIDLYMLAAALTCYACIKYASANVTIITRLATYTSMCCAESANPIYSWLTENSSSSV